MGVEAELSGMTLVACPGQEFQFRPLL